MVFVSDTINNFCHKNIVRFLRSDVSQHIKSVAHIASVESSSQFEEHQCTERLADCRSNGDSLHTR